MSSNNTVIPSRHAGLICNCGQEILGFYLNDLDTPKLKEWFIMKREPLTAAMVARERNRLLLPRINARLTSLAKQLYRLEKKYKLPHQKVNARDLVAFGIKYPLDNRVFDYQYREYRHSPVRDLDGTPLCNDNEFIQIKHTFEPRLYDVRFHLEREIELSVLEYNRLDRWNYYREFQYDLMRLLPKGFPARDHLHCVFSKLISHA